jgi:hypothetical protein
MLSFAVEWRAQPEPRKKSPSHTFAAPTCSIFSKDMNSGKEIFFKRTAECSRAKESLLTTDICATQKSQTRALMSFLAAVCWHDSKSPLSPKKIVEKYFQEKLGGKIRLKKNTENSRNIK